MKQHLCIWIVNDLQLQAKLMDFEGRSQRVCICLYVVMNQEVRLVFLVVCHTTQMFNRTAPNQDSEGEQYRRTDWDLAFC